MITFNQALAVTLGQASVYGVERVDFTEVSGRVLASDVFIDMDIPPFNRSAMDGFACRREDLGRKLEIIEVIPAGHTPGKQVGQGQCSQIMTGAIIPEGADTVIKVEDILLENGSVSFTAGKTSANICYHGEDARKGDLILPAGTLLSSRHVPILATAGAVSVDVYLMPEIALLSTGTELVEPYHRPGISQIRNSNAYQMASQFQSMGIDPDYYGIAPDEEEVTFKMIGEALENDDILVLSGGVSMGEFDFVPSILQKHGMNILFQRVAIQPGKPTLFGTGKGKYVFGLPGNPVSSFFTLEMLVKPFIYKCMGHVWDPPSWKMRTGVRITRKKTERLSWIPVRIGPDGLLYPVDYHGSAHIFALKDAQGIIDMPIGTGVIESGELIDVRPL